MAQFMSRDDARRRLEGFKSRHPTIYKDIIQDQYAGVAFKPTDVDGANVLDLGAHIGAFSLLCLSHGARMVTCVEANPKTFKELLSNMDGFPARLLNLAATDGSTPSIYLCDEDAQSRVSDSGVEVPTITLEALEAGLGGIGDRVLKVDIEGSEYATMLAAPARVIRSFKTVFLEFHPPPEPKPGRSYVFLKEYMGLMGFKETKKSPMFWWTWVDGKATSCVEIENMVNCRFDRE